MSGINLNNEEFNGGSNFKIFNGGTAGVCRDSIGLRIERGVSPQPDYKLFFKDKSDAEINMGLYYINEATETDKNKIKYGAKLKHLVHCYLGKDTVIPTMATYKELTDWVISQIEPLFNQVVVRLLVTYGTTQYPKNFLQVRGYVPFIEAESTPIGDSVLKLGDIDQKTRPVADQPVLNNSNGSSVI